MSRNHVPPSVRKSAFNCPHCDAFAKQDWHLADAISIPGKELPTKLAENWYRISTLNDGEPLPHPDEESDEAIDPDSIERFLDSESQLRLGSSSESRMYKGPLSIVRPANSVFFSQCSHCKGSAIWVGTRMIYPLAGSASPPNPDLPEESARCYREANAILGLSPRGAAALAQLALEELFKHLERPGRGLNAQIKALVEEGIDPKVQEMLDIVRVVGNNAVHPGQIDLKDNREIADTLLSLINIIAETLITFPNQISELYETTVPESARDAIAHRDGHTDT